MRIPAKKTFHLGWASVNWQHCGVPAQESNALKKGVAIFFSCAGLASLKIGQMLLTLSHQESV
jgi:hypothetical protein